MRVPHPLLLMLGCIAIAASLTWVVPAGEFERREDAATGRTVVVAGTYQRVEAAPVGPFAALVAVPRGFVEAADVVGVILFVGGAWVVLDTLGTLGRLVGVFVNLLGQRRSVVVPLVILFFSGMGALENMQEEIIPLVPVLLFLGHRIGVDAVTVVAMSMGAAMIGSAFGPANPFQAGIAMKLAELPPLAQAGLRTGLWAVATVLWTLWTMRGAGRKRPGLREPQGDPVSSVQGDRVSSAASRDPVSTVWRDVLAVLCLFIPMAAYVYGALAWEWGFNELSAGFIAGALAAGLVGGLSLTRTVEVFLDGMKGLVMAAVLVGVARSISLVLADGRIVDTILSFFAAPLSEAPPAVAGFLMIPFHALIHIPVSSVSGHAVLTMPLLVPLSDLIGVSRMMTVMAYQMGAGLTELLTPTNGAMMAVITAAGVPYGQWARFALPGVLLALCVGVVGMLLVG